MFDQVLSRHGALTAFTSGAGVTVAASIPERSSGSARPASLRRTERDPLSTSPGTGPIFGQVLARRGLREYHYGSGSVLTALFYAGVVSFGAWAQAQPRPIDRQDVLVQFVAPPRLRPPAPPTPAPAPPRAASAAPRPRLRAIPDRPHVVLAQVIVAPTEIPRARPPEADPAPHARTDAGEAEGGDAEVSAVPGGITMPVVDVADAGAGAGGGGTEARPPVFEEARMTHPRFVSGPSPRYTQKALEREVEGTIEVRCIVTAAGRVKDCRVVKSLPFMDRAVVEALEERRYEPATLAGRAIDVFYRFRIPLRLAE